MKYYDLEFTDYLNRNDFLINKAIYELIDFEEVDFIFCWIEFKSISHYKGTKHYSIRIHNLGDEENNE